MIKLEWESEGGPMNFVFISPNFPTDFAQFCVGLKENGANVLGINRKTPTVVPKKKNGDSGVG